MGQRISPPPAPDRKPSGVRISLRARHYRARLLHRFPLMLLLIVFTPLLAAILILLGAPARLTALIGAATTTLAALIALCLYHPVPGGFQFITSFTISESWGLHFLLGADGLSLI